MEGGGWDLKKSILVDSQPKELFIEMPIIFFKTMKTEEMGQMKSARD